MDANHSCMFLFVSDTASNFPTLTVIVQLKLPDDLIAANLMLD